MYKIDYTDEQWRAAILALDLADWLRDWSLVQVDRTQDYYISRIAQLGMQGERVLDAGCGMGNWSMGLVRHYQRVDAIEIDRARLDVLKAVCPHFNGRIVPEVGSVHELPYPDASFDGVFCNGVLFVTDYRKTLAEFRRVLKPGGQLYVTYCGMDWWRHVLVERGVNEPECIVYGSNGLIHYLWCQLDKLWNKNGNLDIRLEAGILDSMWRLVSPDEPHPHFLFKRKLLARIREKKLDHLKRTEFKPIFDMLHNYLSSGVQSDSPVAVERAIKCLSLLAMYSPEEYLGRVVKDVASRLVAGKADYVMDIDTWTFSPEEMTKEVSVRGFENVLSGREGGLNNLAGNEMVQPIYGGYMGVFETCAWKLA